MASKGGANTWLGGWREVATSLLGEVSVSYRFGPFVTSQRAEFLTFQMLTSGNFTNRIATLRKYR